MRLERSSLAVLALSVSCVSSNAGYARAYDTGPRLVSCPENSVSPSTASRPSVELRYEVGTDGRVSRVRVVPNANATQASDATITAATNLALACRYEPALKGGQPVVATISRWFTVDQP
jgi:hypothetical protein